MSGRPPPDAEAVTPLINAEYLQRYDEGENSRYARGTLEPQHVERTLELLPLSG